MKKKKEAYKGAGKCRRGFIYPNRSHFRRRGEEERRGGRRVEGWREARIKKEEERKGRIYELLFNNH